MEGGEISKTKCHPVEMESSNLFNEYTVKLQHLNSEHNNNNSKQMDRRQELVSSSGREKKKKVGLDFFF